MKNILENDQGSWWGHLVEFLSYRDLLALRRVSITCRLLSEQEYLWWRLLERDHADSYICRLPVSLESRYLLQTLVSKWSRLVVNRYLHPRLMIGSLDRCFRCYQESFQAPQLITIRSFHYRPTEVCLKHQLGQIGAPVLLNLTQRFNGRHYYGHVSVLLVPSLISLLLWDVGLNEIILVQSSLSRLLEVIRLLSTTSRF